MVPGSLAGLRLVGGRVAEGALFDTALGYLDERVRTRDLDPMTARNYRTTLRIFARVISETATLATITEDDLNRWLEVRSCLSQSSRRGEWSRVKTFLTWAQRKRLIAHNPALDMRAPRQPRSVPRALPSASVGALLRACPDSRARAICWLMVGMGLRCKEVSGIEVGDWNRESHSILVRGKGSHEREVAVPPEVLPALSAYLVEFPASAGPLIRSYRRPGMQLQPDTLSGMVSEWMRAAHVKQRPWDGVAAHSLRHTAASDVLDGCDDLRVVQEMLGHRQLATTSIYLRRAGLRKMREAMGGRTYSA